MCGKLVGRIYIYLVDMLINDPIADLLARIVNAQQRRKKTMRVPKSDQIERIVKLLVKNKFLAGYETVESEYQGVNEDLIISLRYVNKQGVISEVTRVSKPGSRRYSSYKELETYMRGIGMTVVSTPKGIMTATEARKEKVGGEILFRIW